MGSSAVGGCGAPISNQVFLEEALFLGALPTEARFGAPASVLLAPNGDAAVLKSAKQAASDWDDLWGLLIAAGDQLQRATPDESTDVVRRWSGVDVATRLLGDSTGLPAGVLTFAVSAEIVRPDDGDVSWELGFAPTIDGPFTTAVSGTHTNDELVGPHGVLDWDVTATVTALGAQPSAPLGIVSAEYIDHDDTIDYLRNVTASRTLLPGLVESYALVGDETFGFAGQFLVSSDGADWTGGASVYHGSFGGWGHGVALVDGAPLAFDACWDANGLAVWQGGDAGIAAFGDASRCPITDPL